MTSLVFSQVKCNLQMLSRTKYLYGEFSVEAWPPFWWMTLTYICFQVLLKFLLEPSNYRKE